MNNQPLVSVIMNCYNSDTYLGEAIDSVIAQTYQNWEIIFWDNQSTDKSAEIVKSYNDVRIKYFYAPEHTTLGEGRNKALEKVNGEFVSFLDCDDILNKHKIELQINAFLKDDRIGFVYSNGARIDEKGKVKTPFYHDVKPSGNILRQTIKYYDIYIPTVMIRRSVIIENNIVFKNYKYIEEYDFFLRILLKADAKFLENKLAFWRVHGQSDTWNNYDKFADEREDFIINFFDSDMEKEYREEIESIRNLNTFQKALVCWKSSNKKQALKIIKPIKFKSKKFFVSYLMMHFDFSFLYPLIIKFKYIK